MPVDGDAFHFNLGGKVATFSLIKFVLMIGLKITNDKTTHDNIQRSNKLHDAYFQGQEDSASVATNWRNQGMWPDVRQTEVRSDLHPWEHGTAWSQKDRFDLFHLDIVDNIDAFNLYLITLEVQGVRA